MQILILRHGRYPDDPRVSKEVHSLIEEGFDVDIICLRGKNQPLKENKEKIRIFRLPFSHKRGTVFRYFFEYGISFFLMSTLTFLLFLKYRYRVIQVNTMPDFLVFATIFPKLMGAKILLDMHEPTPELWITNYGSNRFRLLLHIQTKIENYAIKYADLASTVTQNLRRQYGERGADISKISVIPNVCDESIFSSTSMTNQDKSNVFSIITHGSIEKRYGHEVIIQAVKLIKEKIPNLQYNIIGEGSHESHLIKLVTELGCENYIKFLGFLPFEKMLQTLKNADVGIIAMYKTPYSELIDTNKMYEYIALKIPVITSRLAAIEENFNDSSLMYFEPGNSVELAQCIFTVYNNAKRRNELITNAYYRYKMLEWNKSKKIYLKLIYSLYNNKR